MEAELLKITLEIDEAAHCLSMGQEDEAANHLATAATLLQTFSIAPPAKQPVGSLPEPAMKKIAAA